MAAISADIFGPDLLIVVLVVVVLLFGGAAIPKLARNLGSARKEFSKGMTESPDGDGKSDGDKSDGEKAAAKADAPKPDGSSAGSQ